MMSDDSRNHDLSDDSLSEFDIIQTFFNRSLPAHQAVYCDLDRQRPDVALGVGDDCALLRVPPGQSLAVSMDTLVEGVHFPESMAPEDLSHKALMVNLSDLAAMGAEPAWVTLSLTLPKVDKAWLQAFSDSFYEVLHHFQVQLVGGDMTSGPLSVTVQVHGFVPEDGALKRQGAQVGDLICVTGALGKGALGLMLEQKQLEPKQFGDNWALFFEDWLTHYRRPTAQVAAGIVLRRFATSAIDVSDGLIADLAHICRVSGVSALIDTKDLPLAGKGCDADSETLFIDAALAGGDDYELCFTLNEVYADKAMSELEAVGVKAHVIGRIQSKSGVQVMRHGAVYTPKYAGFDHFKKASSK